MIVNYESSHDVFDANVVSSLTFTTFSKNLRSVFNNFKIKTLTKLNVEKSGRSA